MQRPSTVGGKNNLLTDKIRSFRVTAVVYASIAVGAVFVSVIPILLLFAFVPPSVRKVMTDFATGMAFITLVGDSFLHLIPDAIRVNEHESKPEPSDQEESQASETEQNSRYNRSIGVVLAANETQLFHSHDLPTEQFISMITIIVTIFVLFFLEKSLDLFFDLKHKHKDFEHTKTAAKQDYVEKEVERNKEKKNEQQLDRSPLTALIIVADIMHNLCDGLAVGAAFSVSYKGGFLTALAMIFHEVPHTIGDFSLLISSGLTMKKAAFLILLTSLPAFLGAFIGIVLSKNDTVNRIIQSMTAGVFLFVSMTEVLPLMKRTDLQNPKVTFIIFNAGIFMGLALVIVVVYLI